MVRVRGLVAAKHRVGRILDAGGMGVVVLATQVAVDRAVALRFSLPQVRERPHHVARFAREARAAAEIERPSGVRPSPNTVRRSSRRAKTL
jgi:hypothetical protein